MRDQSGSNQAPDGGPTILVTGGAGYIGSHAVLALSESGYRVIVLDNLVYGHREAIEWIPGVRLVVGDIGDRKLVDDLLQRNPVAAAMHFSAYTYVGESVERPSKYYRNNVVSTLTLLDALIEAGIRRFIFSSTCATYGVPQIIPIPEDHPQNPINPYGASKLMVERILNDYDHAYGLRSVIFRYFNAVGADPAGRIGEHHDPETHLIPLVLDAALDGSKAIQIFGTDYPTPDGTCIRDYIHVSDLAQAHLLGLEFLLREDRSERFNLGNGGGYSVREVIETARRVTGRPIRQIEQARRAGDPPALIGEAGKAKALLGWQPRYPGIGTIIEHAWGWHQRLKSVAPPPGTEAAGAACDT